MDQHFGCRSWPRSRCSGIRSRPSSPRRSSVEGRGRSAAEAATFTVEPTQIVFSGRSDQRAPDAAQREHRDAPFQLSVFKWTQSPSGEMQLEPTEDIVFFPALLTLAPSREPPRPRRECNGVRHAGEDVSHLRRGAPAAGSPGERRPRADEDGDSHLREAGEGSRVRDLERPWPEGREAVLHAEQRRLGSLRAPGDSRSRTSQGRPRPSTIAWRGGTCSRAAAATLTWPFQRLNAPGSHP